MAGAGDLFDEMLEHFVLAGLPKPSCFHAKDIYHGTREFHGGHWPPEVRISLPAEMAIVGSFSI